MHSLNLPAIRSRRPAWNKGRIVGQKRPLLPKHETFGVGGDRGDRTQCQRGAESTVDEHGQFFLEGQQRVVAEAACAGHDSSGIAM